ALFAEGHAADTRKEHDPQNRPTKGAVRQRDGARPSGLHTRPLLPKPSGQPHMPEPPVHLALRSTQGVSARVGNEALVNLTSPTTATEVNPQMDVRNSKLKLALGAASLFLFL